jgi:hypothetical protein
MHKRLERGDRVITERDLVLKEYEIVRVTKLTAVGQRGDNGEVKFPREFESGDSFGHAFYSYSLYAGDDPALDKIVKARKAYQQLVKINSAINQPVILKSLSLKKIDKINTLFQEILIILANGDDS